MTPARLVIVIVLFVSLVAVSAMRQIVAPAPTSLARFIPAGPLLYLQAKDFSALVRDWNRSGEKQRWMESQNRQAFSRSRLFLRLEEAYAEFSTAAGMPPDMSLIASAAGDQTALALYDIGKLEFLYITRLPSARAAETALWQTRGQYEPRQAAGASFYVRADRASGRVVGFAATNDFLILGTREDLLAGALALIAGGADSSLAQEPWFDRSLRAASTEGELRLVMKLDALVRSPHFRSYWIQRNVSELRQFTAAIADVYRSPTEIREQRVFLRADTSASSATDQTRAAQGSTASDDSLSQVLELLPVSAGAYRAWSAPTVEQVLSLLEKKVIAPKATFARAARTAPVVGLSEGVVGSESDLETKIDEVPWVKASDAFMPEALREVLNQAKVDAVAQIESTRPAPDGVFVDKGAVVVVQGAATWNREAVQEALRTAVQRLLTTSGLGVEWEERSAGSATYYRLNGPGRVVLAIAGRHLMVSNDLQLLEAVLAQRPTARSELVGGYAAGVRINSERDRFLKLMQLIDHTWIEGTENRDEAETREPHFFSENIASLLRTLSRMESASIVERDAGDMVSQTVIYRLGR